MFKYLTIVLLCCEVSWAVTYCQGTNFTAPCIRLLMGANECKPITDNWTINIHSVHSDIRDGNCYFYSAAKCTGTITVKADCQGPDNLTNTILRSVQCDRAYTCSNTTGSWE